MFGRRFGSSAFFMVPCRSAFWGLFRAVVSELTAEAKCEADTGASLLYLFFHVRSSASSPLDDDGALESIGPSLRFDSLRSELSGPLGDRRCDTVFRPRLLVRRSGTSSGAPEPLRQSGPIIASGTWRKGSTSARPRPQLRRAASGVGRMRQGPHRSRNHPGSADHRRTPCRSRAGSHPAGASKVAQLGARRVWWGFNAPARHISAPWGGLCGGQAVLHSVICRACPRVQRPPGFGEAPVRLLSPRIDIQRRTTLVHERLRGRHGPDMDQQQLGR